ncbi:MAG: motility associated factor glycosyltransferase family protein [Cellvibrionaceae bacterium]
MLESTAREPSNAMTDLDALIKQAEQQKLQMEMELQFQRNMALFKEFAKPIYDQFFNYTPTELKVGIDSGGHLNLINTNDGRAVYREDPKAFCKKQVAGYAQNPRWFKVRHATPSDDYFFQTLFLQELLDKYQDQINAQSSDFTKPIGVLIMNGCGLGYQITELIEKAEIYNLVIFEAHRDSFHACLHTLDWEPIIRYFQRPGRRIRMFLGASNEITINRLRTFSLEAGLYNLTNTYIYQHLQSDKALAFTNQLREQFHLALTGTGFLEDEQICIAHTIENMNRNVPVMKEADPLPSLPPAFVVGNGPSLDELLETLKAQQSNAVIISCGSTLGTLYKAGIVPDIHVEMERTDGTTQMLLEITDEDYRKKIPILGLNTVAPESLAFFKRAAVATKSNDPGEHIMKSIFGKSMPSLVLSNPTCTNTGLSFAIELGFKEIYLAGVDLGMKSDSQRHASLSQYNDKSSKTLNAVQHQEAGLEVKGNFVDTVKTTQILDTSRANMEVAAKNNRDIKIFNLSDGAYIDGTHPLRKEELELASVKPCEIVDQLFDHYFELPNLSEWIDTKKATAAYVQHTLDYIKNLSMIKNPKNLKEVQEELDRVLLEVNGMKETYPVSYWLLMGTVQNYFTLINRICLSSEDTRTMQENYRYCLTMFSQLLHECRKLLKENLLRLHSLSAENKTQQQQYYQARQGK